VLSSAVNNKLFISLVTAPFLSTAVIISPAAAASSPVVVAATILQGSRVVLGEPPSLALAADGSAPNAFSQFTTRHIDCPADLSRSAAVEPVRPNCATLLVEFE